MLFLPHSLDQPTASLGGPPSLTTVTMCGNLITCMPRAVSFLQAHSSSVFNNVCMYVCGYLITVSYCYLKLGEDVGTCSSLLLLNSSVPMLNPSAAGFSRKLGVKGHSLGSEYSVGPEGWKEGKAISPIVDTSSVDFRESRRMEMRRSWNAEREKVFGDTGHFLSL